MKKLFYFIGFTLLLIGCSQRETDPNLLISLRMATDQLAYDIDSRVSEIHVLIGNNGNEPSDVERQKKLTDILETHLSVDPTMQNEFLQSIQEAGLELELQKMDKALSVMEYYSMLYSNDQNELNYLMWKMNMLLVQRELINQVSVQFRTHDISFSICCAASVTSNLNRQNVGKEVSVVITNPEPRVEMTYREVQIMKGDAPVRSEIIQMGEVAVVRFKSSGIGDYRIKFESAATTRDTTMVQQQVVILGQK